MDLSLIDTDHPNLSNMLSRIMASIVGLVVESSISNAAQNSGVVVSLVDG